MFLVTTYKLKADLTRKQKREFITALPEPYRPGTRVKRLKAPPGTQHYLTENGRRGLIIIPTDLPVKDPASDWVDEFTEDYKPWLVFENDLMHEFHDILEIAARALLAEP